MLVAAHLKMTLYAESVWLHCCFSQHSDASSSTLVHTLQIFAIFVHFALVPSHALGASTSRAAPLFIKMLLSAARLLCGYLRQQIQKCYWSQIQMMYKEKSFSTMTDSRAQNGFYVVAVSCKITNGVGNVPIWGEKYKSASSRKYKWCTMRNPSVHWLPEKWRNWRKGVKGPQGPDEIFQIVSKWQNLKFIHDWIQFRWAF